MKRVLVIVFLLVLALSCDSFIYDGSVTIRYEVDGTAPAADVTIENANGGISQYDNVAMGWWYEWDTYISSDDYLFVYVSAQNQGSSGSVTTRILYSRDGGSNWTLYKTSTSSGAYVIATSSGGLELY
jgi:hypothetical protein